MDAGGIRKKLGVLAGGVCLFEKNLTTEALKDTEKKERKNGDNKMKKQIVKRIIPKEPKEAFQEAERYFANAKEILGKTQIEYDRYQDKKYVKEGCAMAYVATLSVIDSYLLSIGTEKKKLPTTISEYTKSLRKIPHNGKLIAAMGTVYENLHICGYYRGLVGVGMIKEGFQKAKFIIDTLSTGVEKCLA